MIIILCIYNIVCVHEHWKSDVMIFYLASEIFHHCPSLIANTPNRDRKDKDISGDCRSSFLHSQASSVTEVASDEIDIEEEPQGLTT